MCVCVCLGAGGPNETLLPPISIKAGQVMPVCHQILEPADLEFPVGPVVRTRCSHCLGQGSFSRGTKISQTAQWWGDRITTGEEKESGVRKTFI